jgi:hypothetical protein
LTNGALMGKISPWAAVATESRDRIVRGPRKSKLWLFVLPGPSAGLENWKKSEALGSVMLRRGTSAVTDSVMGVESIYRVEGVMSDKGIGRHLNHNLAATVMILAGVCFQPYHQSKQ